MMRPALSAQQKEELAHADEVLQAIWPDRNRESVIPQKDARPHRGYVSNQKKARNDRNLISGTTPNLWDDQLTQLAPFIGHAIDILERNHVVTDWQISEASIAAFLKHETKLPPYATPKNHPLLWLLKHVPEEPDRPILELWRAVSDFRSSPAPIAKQPLLRKWSLERMQLADGLRCWLNDCPLEYLDKYLINHPLDDHYEREQKQILQQLRSGRMNYWRLPQDPSNEL